LDQIIQGENSFNMPFQSKDTLDNCKSSRFSHTSLWASHCLQSLYYYHFKL